MDNSAFLSSDDWSNTDEFLDSLLLDSDLLTDFGSQQVAPDSGNAINIDAALIDIGSNPEAFLKSFDDFSNYDNLTQFKDEPIFSSSASDSGLSSDNLDIDVHHDYDHLSSGISSPSSSHSGDSAVPAEVPRMTKNIKKETNVINTRNLATKRPVEKRQTKNGSKKADSKIHAVKNGNVKPRSILLPVSTHEQQQFRTIKIVNSSHAKSANIKAAAANLLQKSKQGLLNKNIFMPKEEYIAEITQDMDDDYDDDDDYSFDEVMHQSSMVLASVESQNDESSDSGSQYPKLVLNNEEKRLLSKEGISLPAQYPLTKHEERELKRIRRKIRNKISAQDSRKRKKEYIDGLEERVKQCSDENLHLIKRLKVLQTQNHDLVGQMKKLQLLLSRNTSKTAQPATCMMILLLSMALVALPNLKLNNSKDLQSIQNEDLAQQNRRTLLFDFKDLSDDAEVDGELDSDGIPNEHDYVESSSYKYSAPASDLPYKRQRTLVDYELDNGNMEWELDKKNDSYEREAKNFQHARITISKNLFETNTEDDGILNDFLMMNKMNQTESLMDGPGEILQNSIINMAAHTNLQKN